MRYISTRSGNEQLTFEEAVLRGLAPDGGLYIPTTIPTLPSDWKQSWFHLTFVELAYEILSLFIPESAEEGGIPCDDLRKIITRSFLTFRSKEVTPLKQLSNREWCLELWHGPTFAFKDVALQTLGNLFEYFLARRNKSNSSDKGERQTLTVLGATSGDTGSAAIAGLRSKLDISIFILHPKGRVSPIQEAQMTTILDENVHNLALEGTFDDCQDVVKLLFSDRQFNATHHLAAINSINFARILAQIVYYFSAYFQFLKQQQQQQQNQRTQGNPSIQFVVPTGNFGDVLAGYYAKRLGLPMEKLVVATNENDILQRFWKSGRYEKQDSTKKSHGKEDTAAQTNPVGGSSDGAQSATGAVKATLSPAMDILVSSNFERLLWHIVYESEDGKDFATTGQKIKGWMDDLKGKGAFEVESEHYSIAKREFISERVSDVETKETILKYFTADSLSYLIDPHTAVGFHAANRTIAINSPNIHQIILSTAHPAKFAEAVTDSLAAARVPFDFEKDVLPKEMIGLLEKERRVEIVSLQDGTSAGKASVVEKLAQGTRQVIERYAKQNSLSKNLVNGTSITQSV